MINDVKNTKCEHSALVNNGEQALPLLKWLLKRGVPDEYLHVWWHQCESAVTYFLGINYHLRVCISCCSKHLWRLPTVATNRDEHANQRHRVPLYLMHWTSDASNDWWNRLGAKVYSHLFWMVGAWFIFVPLFLTVGFELLSCYVLLLPVVTWQLPICLWH